MNAFQELLILSLHPLVEGLSKEEQLALALKASMDTAREEQAERVVSFIHDRAPGNLLVFFLCFPSFH